MRFVKTSAGFVFVLTLAVAELSSGQAPRLGEAPPGQAPPLADARSGQAPRLADARSGQAPRRADARSGQAPRLADARSGQAGAYWCSMHPDVRGEAGARCPLCGMALVPRPATLDAYWL